MYIQEYSHDYEPAAPIVALIVRNTKPGSAEVTLTALVDSGADATMLPIDILKQVDARYLEARKMRGVTGHSLTIDMYLVTVQIGPYQIPGIQAVAMNEGAEAIIGQDVLNQLVTTLNGLAHVLEISQ